jgi:transcriptional regulator with XRE-family HTH domain
MNIFWHIRFKYSSPPSIFIKMNTDISQVIRERRKLLNVDQKTLARIAGISVHALSDMETGKGNPTLKTVMRVLDVLGMKLSPSIKSPEGIDA